MVRKTIVIFLCLFFITYWLDYEPLKIIFRDIVLLASEFSIVIILGMIVSGILFWTLLKQ